MLLHYLGKADQAKYALKETENLKKHPKHYRSLGMFVKSEVTGRACIGLEQNIIDTAVK